MRHPASVSLNTRLTFRTCNNPEASQPDRMNNSIRWFHGRHRKQKLLHHKMYVHHSEATPMYHTIHVNRQCGHYSRSIPVQGQVVTPVNYWYSVRRFPLKRTRVIDSWSSINYPLCTAKVTNRIHDDTLSSLSYHCGPYNVPYRYTGRNIWWYPTQTTLPMSYLVHVYYTSMC